MTNVMLLSQVSPKRESQPVPFVITCLNLIYKMVGVHPQSEDKRYEWYHICITSTVYTVNSFFMFSYLIVEEKSFSNIANVVLYFSGITSLFLMFCSMHLNRRHFIQCYENVICRSDYIDDYFHKLVEKDLYRNMPRCIVCVAVVYAGLAFYPILIAFCSNAELGSSVTLLVPENAMWDQSTFFGYIVLVGFQIFCGAIAIAVDVSFTCFIGIHGIFIGALFQILREKIKHLNETGGNDEEKLLDVFRCHRHLKTVVHDFSLAIKTVVNVSILHFYTFSVLLLSSLITNLEETEIFDLLKLLNYQFLALAFFTAESFMGEFINNMNDKLRFELYSTNWFEHSVKYRKRVNIILLLLQAPFQMRFLNMTVVNLSLLMSSAEKVYTFIQFLIRVQKK